MHLLRTETRSLDEAEAAIDLAQTPADLVFLSFSDSDLGLFAKVSEGRATNLRLANIAQLKHPFSVDLYIEKMASKARFVLVRLLGGLDYWRYGIEELSLTARAQNFDLAVIPGDDREDLRLDAASTLPVADLRRLWAYLHNGGIANLCELLNWIENRIGEPRPWRDPCPVAIADRFEAGCREPAFALGRVLIVFYRSFMLSGDCEPIIALADALASRKLCVTAVHVTSLKDADVISFMRDVIAQEPPDIIINTTAFSARLDSGPSILDCADAPVLQAILAGSFQAQWEANPRGLNAADLAMNVVLPEMDGRIITPAIAFKAEAERHEDLEFTPLVHLPLPSRIDHVSELAWRWIYLRKTPPAQRKIACILSDYPGKGGRAGYAVGLDTGKSISSIAAVLREAGYDIGALPDPGSLMRKLEAGEPNALFTLEDYRDALRAMPEAFVQSVHARWGEPEQDENVTDGAFHFSFVRAGHLLIGLQPDRGSRTNRKAEYHGGLAPRHSYIAFYLWLRVHEKVHALIHCGTHGTLEWLPGKAVALSECCTPEAVLGAIPVIYPFIVNNPGEAAQAKRRIGAVTIGHMTPPLTNAQSHGAAVEIESLFDEYAAAETLDPKRARLIAQTILERAKDTGLMDESGASKLQDPMAALQELDGWICDLKEMRIRDGLHVFGQSSTNNDIADGLADCCGEAERAGLLAALDGRFVAPGPGGAPSRGRLDVLPTGRNLYGIDPRAVPTRTAWDIGTRTAREVANRYAQDHGEWPQRLVMDLWASATMRTGGDDLAQALCLLGVRPIWDHATARVSGFEILPPACLERPRIDVTLRISGLFRDIFPAQITLFDQAVQAVARLDEEEDVNPLAAAQRKSDEAPLRIFGAAPTAYGLRLSREINNDPLATREELGQLYLEATSHAYGASHSTGLATGDFRMRIAEADAFVHVQDQDEQDLLDADAIIDHAGGFAAAAQSLGNEAAIYHVQSARPGAPKVRTLTQETARVVRARAANPRWIAGQMRHGHRGAAEIAETVDNLFALAVMTDAVSSQHFELLFEAICSPQEVRAFLLLENPKAARAIAERFEMALQRGFWQSRRNSIGPCLAELKGHV